MTQSLSHSFGNARKKGAQLWAWAETELGLLGCDTGEMEGATGRGSCWPVCPHVPVSPRLYQDGD